MEMGTREWWKGNKRTIWKRRGLGEGPFINQWTPQSMATKQTESCHCRLETERGHPDWNLYSDGECGIFTDQTPLLNTTTIPSSFTRSSLTPYSRKSLAISRNSTRVRGGGNATSNCGASCSDDHQRRPWPRINSHSLPPTGENWKGKKKTWKRRSSRREPKVLSLQELVVRRGHDDTRSCGGSGDGGGGCFGGYTVDGIRSGFVQEIIFHEENIYSEWPPTSSIGDEVTRQEESSSNNSSNLIWWNRSIGPTVISDEGNSNYGHQGECSSDNDSVFGYKLNSLDDCEFSCDNPLLAHRIADIERDERGIDDKESNYSPVSRPPPIKKGIVFGLLDLLRYRRNESGLKSNKSKNKTIPRQCRSDYNVYHDHLTALISGSDTSESVPLPEGDNEEDRLTSIEDSPSGLTDKEECQSENQVNCPSIAVEETSEDLQVDSRIPPKKLGKQSPAESVCRNLESCKNEQVSLYPTIWKVGEKIIKENQIEEKKGEGDEEREGKESRVIPFHSLQSDIDIFPARRSIRHRGNQTTANSAASTKSTSSLGLNGTPCNDAIEIVTTQSHDYSCGDATSTQFPSASVLSKLPATTTTTTTTTTISANSTTLTTNSTTISIENSIENNTGLTTTTTTASLSDSSDSPEAMKSGKLARIGHRTPQYGDEASSSSTISDRTSGSVDRAAADGGGVRGDGVHPVLTRHAQRAWAATHCSESRGASVVSPVSRGGEACRGFGDVKARVVQVGHGATACGVTKRSHDAAVDVRRGEGPVSRQEGDAIQTYNTTIETIRKHDAEAEGKEAEGRREGRSESESYAPCRFLPVIMEGKITQPAQPVGYSLAQRVHEGQPITGSVGVDGNAGFQDDDDDDDDCDDGRDDGRNIINAHRVLRKGNVVDDDGDKDNDDRVKGNNQLCSNNLIDANTKTHAENGDLKDVILTGGHERTRDSSVCDPSGNIFSTDHDTVAPSTGICPEKELSLLTCSRNDETISNSVHKEKCSKNIGGKENCEGEITYQVQGKGILELECNPSIAKFNPYGSEYEESYCSLDSNEISNRANPAFDEISHLSERKDLDPLQKHLHPEFDVEDATPNDGFNFKHRTEEGQSQCLEMKDTTRPASTLLYVNQSAINTVNAQLRPNLADFSLHPSNHLGFQGYQAQSPVILAINPDDISSNRLSHQYLNCSITGQNYPDFLPQNSSTHDMIFTATPMKETSFTVKPSPSVGSSGNGLLSVSGQKPDLQDVTVGSPKIEFGSHGTSGSNANSENTKLLLLPSSSASSHHYYNDNSIFAPVGLSNGMGIQCVSVSENQRGKESGDGLKSYLHLPRYPGHGISLARPCSANHQSQNSLESTIVCNSDCCGSSCNNNTSCPFQLFPYQSQSIGPDSRRSQSSLAKPFSPLPMHLQPLHQSPSRKPYPTANIPAEELQHLLQSHRQQQQQQQQQQQYHQKLILPSDPGQHLLLSSLDHRNSCPPMRFPRQGDGQFHHQHHHHPNPNDHHLTSTHMDSPDEDSLVQSVECFKYRIRFSPVSLLWTFLSFLVAGASLFSFLTPYWIIHPDHAHSFGLFNLCVTDPRYTLNRPVCVNYGSQNFNTRTHLAQNGTLQEVVVMDTSASVDIRKIPSGAWQTACLLFGAGCCVQILGAVLSAVVLGLSESWHRKVAMANGYFQTVGVLLLLFGLLIYPAGFGSPFFSYYCESSQPFSTGHCSLGWSYVTAIMTSALSIFCPVMSSFSEAQQASVRKVVSHSASN